jgi:hypothetical protein
MPQNPHGTRQAQPTFRLRKCTDYGREASPVGDRITQESSPRIAVALLGEDERCDALVMCAAFPRWVGGPFCSIRWYAFRTWHIAQSLLTRQGDICGQRLRYRVALAHYCEKRAFINVRPKHTAESVANKPFWYRYH